MHFDLSLLNLCTKPHKVRWREMGRGVKAVLLNLSDNGQIHARNLKCPAERDVPYIACSEGNLDGDCSL